MTTGTVPPLSPEEEKALRAKVARMSDFAGIVNVPTVKALLATLDAARTPRETPDLKVRREVRPPLDLAGYGSPRETPDPFDARRMTHAWAILVAETNPERWEPDRYNAAAFVRALLDKYEWLATATLADLAPNYTPLAQR